VETKAQNTNQDETMTPAGRRELLNELKGCIAQAQDGDEEALSKVRQILKETPRLARIFRDLAGEAESSLLKRVAGDNPLIQEALPAQLKAMRKELAGPDACPLEKLLAERIVACWLQLQYADVIYAQNLGTMNMVQSEYHQRRLDRLQRRYLSSIKALAQIRKLGPAVQINIAEQQINTAG
jgi:predicted trehalose synthase